MPLIRGTRRTMAKRKTRMIGHDQEGRGDDQSDLRRMSRGCQKTGMSWTIPRVLLRGGRKEGEQGLAEPQPREDEYCTFRLPHPRTLLHHRIRTAQAHRVSCLHDRAAQQQGTSAHISNSLPRKHQRHHSTVRSYNIDESDRIRQDTC